MSEEITQNPGQEAQAEVSHEEVVAEMNRNGEEFATQSQEPTQEQVVAYETHQKLLNQRKADQRKARELEDKVRQLTESIKSAENAKLEEKQEYKKLYEATKVELEAKKREQEERDRIIVNKEKQAALNKELGGLKNDAYFRFAELDNIVIDDSGQVDLTSVRLEANRFRQNFPELITPSNPVRVNNQAPSGDAPVLSHQKDAREMSSSEREAFKRKAIMERLKK